MASRPLRRGCPQGRSRDDLGGERDRQDAKNARAREMEGKEETHRRAPPIPWRLRHAAVMAGARRQLASCRSISLSSPTGWRLARMPVRRMMGGCKDELAAAAMAALAMSGHRRALHRARAPDPAARTAALPAPAAVASEPLAAHADDVVDYTLRATLDAGAHTVAGTGTIHFRNASAQPGARALAAPLPERLQERPLRLPSRARGRPRQRPARVVGLHRPPEAVAPGSRTGRSTDLSRTSSFTGRAIPTRPTRGLPCRESCRPARRSTSTWRSTTGSRSSSSEPATGTTFTWSASGFRRSRASSRTGPGPTSRFTTSRSFTPTSGRTTSRSTSPPPTRLARRAPPSRRVSKGAAASSVTCRATSTTSRGRRGTAGRSDARDDRRRRRHRPLPAGLRERRGAGPRGASLRASVRVGALRALPLRRPHAGPPAGRRERGRRHGVPDAHHERRALVHARSRCSSRRS